MEKVPRNEQVVRGKLRLIHQQHSWYRFEKAVTDMQTRSVPAQQRVEEEVGEQKGRNAQEDRYLGSKRA